jgi:deoxyribose-phosphate aldolase
MNKADFVKITDYTLLSPAATYHEIRQLCDEASRIGFGAICVHPTHVLKCSGFLAKSPVRICCVVGFPMGANHQSTKIREAVRAINDGATEIDMVINLGKLVSGDTLSVAKEIELISNEVHSAAKTNVLKVIIESAALTRNQVIDACQCAVYGVADFVKTSTGFHPAGGASANDVLLIKSHCENLGVKASGGIKTLVDVRVMIAAGASRLGIGRNSSLAILKEFEQQ